MSESQQRYRVIEKLESGGMAEVFRAESEGLQGFRKQVAIKRVLPHLSEKKKFIAMFLDEARLSAQLSQSNCVQVFDIGVGDNAYFIVMEFVDGSNLKALAEALRRQNRLFPVEIAAYIALEICKGLSYAHELRDNQGVHLEIVHRDMSPPNVLITKHGEVKIVDFGLAKASSQLEKSEPGIIKGKFAYLSPEAATGAEVDLRSDIFAVGIMLWEFLTGQRLFLADSDLGTVKRVQQAVIPPLGQYISGPPPELERILLKSLARDPQQRYQTARDLGTDLTRFLFAYGKPVSTFDVAALVQLAMRDKSPKARQPQGSIIDKLIEEALFEFTSLKEDAEAEQPQRQPSLGARPLDAGAFVDTTNWASEIGISDARRTNEAHIRQSLRQLPEDGSLASLEETEHAPQVSLPARGPAATPSGARQGGPNFAASGSVPVVLAGMPPAPKSQGAAVKLPGVVAIAPKPLPKSNAVVVIAAVVVALMLIGLSVALFFLKR
jgi:eukaryotic-like serine/threonine-protein kinase